MTARIHAALASLTPDQASIVAVLLIGSIVAAALAVWGFTVWNRRALTKSRPSVGFIYNPNREADKTGNDNAALVTRMTHIDLS